MALVETLLSVVVPVYNGAAYIEGCLGSLSRALEQLPPQHRETIEVIICDNHSTDATKDLAGKHAFTCPSKIIQPPEHCPNRTKNWHCGLSAASGQWMMMLHADDLMAPQGLITILHACRTRASRSASLICGRHRVFKDVNAPGNLNFPWPLPSLVRGKSLCDDVASFHCPFVPFIAMRRETYIQIGGLDFRYELVQDWDLWFRLLEKGDLYFTPAETGLFRSHPVSKNYAALNAREHVALAELFASRATGAKAQQIRQAGLARGVVWLPEDQDPASLLTTMPELTVAQIPSRQQAQKMLDDNMVQVRKNLRKLWLMGTLRLPKKSLFG